jgi:hypothetical protein
VQQAGSCPLEMKLELEAGATVATAPGAGDPTFQAVQERCRVTLARYKDPSTFSSSARCRFNLGSCPALEFGLVLKPRPENGLQMALAGSCQTNLPYPSHESSSASLSVIAVSAEDSTPLAECPV